jgi:PKD repeat protein
LSADAVVPEPTIVSIGPSSGLQGQSLSVIITGTNFGSVPATGAVRFGAGIMVNSYTVDSDTQITASITISGAASAGARDVLVTTATKTGGFTVISRRPPPCSPYI